MRTYDPVVVRFPIAMRPGFDYAQPERFRLRLNVQSGCLAMVCGKKSEIGNRESEIGNQGQAWTWVRGVMERSPPAAGRRFNSSPAAEAQMRRYAARDGRRFDFSLKGKFNDSKIQRFEDSKIQLTCVLRLRSARG